MTAGLDRLIAAIDGTWPSAETRDLGPVTLRRGAGGGNRVSAATVRGEVTGDDIEAAETAMEEMGQTPLFMIRPGDEALDAMLEERGYATRDTSIIYVCPPDRLCDTPIPRVTVLHVEAPLAIMREIWARGGIGPDRLAVMERAKGSKTYMLGRLKDKPGGVAFGAIHDGIAMIHAVEVEPPRRRMGMAGWFMRSAAFWARDTGADTLSVICTEANTGANALYTSLGMEPVGQYHYRYRPTDPTRQ